MLKKAKGRKPTAPSTTTKAPARKTAAVGAREPMAGAELRARTKAATPPKALARFLDESARLTDVWEVVDTAAARRVAAWRPPAAYCVVEGDLVVNGNLVVGTGKHDRGMLIVFGNVVCRNVITLAGWSLVVTGSLSAEEVIVATAVDSTTYVGGSVRAILLESGPGAWLTLFDAKKLAAKVTGYVLVGARVLKPKSAGSAAILVPAVVESEEWDAMAEEDREGEAEEDYVSVKVDAAAKRLAKGLGLLREASRGRRG